MLGGHASHSLSHRWMGVQHLQSRVVVAYSNLKARLGVFKNCGLGKVAA